MTSRRIEGSIRGRAERPLRGLTLALAIVLALVLTVYPVAAIGASGRPSLGLLALLLWGICAGFVHGVGFAPRAAAWRIALGPWIALPLMMFGALVLARNVLT